MSPHDAGDGDRAGNFGRVQHHVVLVRPLTIRRHVVAWPLPIAGVNKSAGRLRFGRFLNFYAARFAMRSMRRAMSSFVIAPPQSHEKACRSSWLSSKNRMASAAVCPVSPALRRVLSAAAAAKADAGW